MQAIQRAQRTAVIAAAAALALALSAATARAQNNAVTAALNLAPKDAPVVFVVPNMQQLSQKVAQFNDNLGLGAPQLADLLGNFKRQGAINAGLKDDGPALVIIPSVKAIEDSKDGGEPPMLAVLPVTDYKAFVGNYQPEALGDLTKLTMPDGDTWFARQSGNFVVMGEAQPLVQAYQAGNASAAILASAGELGGKYVTTSDAALYVNVAAIAPTVRPMLKDAYDQMLREMDLDQAALDPAAADMMKTAKAMIQIYFEAADAVLRDGNGGVVAGDLSNLGVGLTYALQFKAGSETAKIFPGGGGAADLLAKLPKQPYLFAQAFNLKGIDLGRIVNNVSARLPKDQGGWLGEMIQKSMPLIQKAQGMAQMYLVPGQPAAVGGGLFQGLSVVQTNDAKGYVQAYRDYLAAMGNIKMPLAPAGAAGGPALAMGFKTSYTPNATQVEGVSVDSYELALDIPPALMAQMGPAAMMMNMFGLAKQSGHLAAVGDYVIITTTPNATVVGQGITALKEGNGLGADDLITKVRTAGLPPNAAAESYINMAGLAGMINNFMMVFAPTMPPIQVPANLPPVAMGAGVKAGGVAARVYVPVPVITFVKDTVMQFQAAGQRPRGPGRPRAN